MADSKTRSMHQLIDLIQRRFASLSPQLRIGARHMIDHRDQVSLLSMRALAAEARVQPATLVRLAQQLGYSGWAELKQIFDQDLAQHADGYTARARVLVYQEGRECETPNLRLQVANLLALAAENHDPLATAVNLLHDASRIYIAGFRSCYAPALSLKYLCSLFRPDVLLIDNATSSFEQQLRYLTGRDALVVISFAPYSREIAVAASAAKRHHCPLIALSDSKVAPIALNAASVLTFRTDGTSFFPSTVAIQALVELLAQQLLVRTGDKAIRELTQAEADLHASGAYLPDQPKPRASTGHDPEH